MPPFPPLWWGTTPHTLNTKGLDSIVRHKTWGSHWALLPVPLPGQTEVSYFSLCHQISYLLNGWMYSSQKKNKKKTLWGDFSPFTDGAMGSEMSSVMQLGHERHSVQGLGLPRHSLCPPLRYSWGQHCSGYFTHVCSQMEITTPAFPLIPVDDKCTFVWALLDGLWGGRGSCCFIKQNITLYPKEDLGLTM